MEGLASARFCERAVEHMKAHLEGRPGEITEAGLAKRKRQILQPLALRQPCLCNLPWLQL